MATKKREKAQKPAFFLNHEWTLIHTNFRGRDRKVLQEVTEATEEEAAGRNLFMATKRREKAQKS